MHSSKHSSLISPTLTVQCLLLCIVSIAMALEDGDLYKIISPDSGKVLTVESTRPTDGADVILSPWTGNSNQKWLAVQAVVAGDNYLLMPQQQRWDWNRFLRNGQDLRETKERHNDLPDWSLVLQGDSRGQVAQQPRDSKKNQQWRSQVVNSNSGSKTVVIKNIQENKCLQAPGTPKQGSQISGFPTTTPATTSSTESPGLFRRVRSWFGSWFSSSPESTSTATTVTPTTTTRSASSSSASGASTKITLASCDTSNSLQQWTLETLPIRG